MFHGSGWWSYIRYDEKRDRPQVSWALLRRVWQYARPYRLKAIGLLITIFIITGFSLIPPLLFRDLIDNALPNEDMTRLIWLTLAMIGIPHYQCAYWPGSTLPQCHHRRTSDCRSTQCLV